MADYQVKAKSEDIPWEYQTQFGDAASLQNIAQQLMAQRAIIQKGMQPQMVSGHYIKASPMQHLADLLAAGLSGKASYDASQARTNVLRKMAADESRTIEALRSQYGGGREMEADPRGAEQAALLSSWERARNLGKAWGDDRRAMNTATSRHLTGRGAAAMAASGTAPTDPGMYVQQEKFGDVAPIPGLTTPEGKPIHGQQSSKTGEWKEKGTDRAPKQSVTVLSGSNEKPYLTKAQEGMAATDVAAYNAALMADEANQSLGRIKGFLAEGGKVTGGPLAQVEVFARNLAAEYGIPLDRALDRNNARLTAEFTNRIAMQVLSGGRGISNDDRVALEAAFPSFKTGIPAEQLPAFIAQLEAINNAKIASWMRRYNSLSPENRVAYPNTFGSHRSLPAGGGPTYDDPEKEQRYQDWKHKQGVQ